MAAFRGTQPKPDLLSSQVDDENQPGEEAMDQEEDNESPTTSVMDQVKVIQGNMNKDMTQLLQMVVQENEEWKKKTASLEGSLAAKQRLIDSLQLRKKERDAEVDSLKKTLYSTSYQLKRSTSQIRLPSPHTCANVLIINNTKFTTTEMSERTGAEGDTEKLAEAFRSLPVNIEVKTYQDLDLPRMLNVLREEANRDHTDEDFFVCCMMSHGTQGKVFAADGFSVELLDILSLFNGKRCPSLEGKPKLFFIQACQGDKDQTVEIAPGAHSDAKPSPSPILAYLTTEVDFFLALATVPGYVAYRGEDGADFVNVLAKVLKEHGESQDLMSMMATVSKELNERYKYSPFCCTTLRHKLFFRYEETRFQRRGHPRLNQSSIW